MVQVIALAQSIEYYYIFRRSYFDWPPPPVVASTLELPPDSPLSAVRSALE